MALEQQRELLAPDIASLDRNDLPVLPNLRLYCGPQNLVAERAIAQDQPVCAEAV